MWGRSRYDDGYDRDGYDHSLLLRLTATCHKLGLRKRLLHPIPTAQLGRKHEHLRWISLNPPVYNFRDQRTWNR